MQQTVTLSNDQATALAAALYPAIKGFIDDNRAEYEQWLKTVWEPAHSAPKGKEA